MEQFLKLSQLLLVVLDLLGSLLVAFVTVFEIWVDVFKLDRDAGSDSEAIHIFHFAIPASV
jgi:hypothetical protein